MTQKLVISTVGQAENNRRSGETSPRLAESEFGHEPVQPNPQPETLRHRHQIKARQARARRVIHHRRMK